MKSVWIHPQAVSEFHSAIRYYQQQEEKLGRRFFAAVGTAIESIQLNPKIYRNFDADCRKCRVLKFPYGVIFREKGEKIQIIAIMHLHRRPGYWKKRL